MRSLLSFLFLPTLAVAFLVGCSPASAAEPIRVRPVTWAQPVLGVEIGNCYQVSADVYRSEQPDDDQLGQIQALGIRSFLSLREYHADDRDFAVQGITLYRVPMAAGSITTTQIAEALRIIRDAPKPILVHCWHGSDRTGAVIASYRMAEQQWLREDAVDEFIHGGFGYHAGWYPGIETFLRELDVAAVRP